MTMSGKAALALILLLSALAGCRGAPAAQPDATAVAENEAELLSIGQKVYRDGLLQDGHPVQAQVVGGVPIDGTQVTCQHCHRRSGMGGAEGDRFVLPISGPVLYGPRQNLYRDRPAYTDMTLATVLRTGLDPAGHQLDPVMPVYDLPELEMAALVAYLKNLSREHSAGVSESTIHLATVIGPGVDTEVSSAMLEVLDKYFSDKNSGTRLELRRKESGPFFHEDRNKAYRLWELHRWTLSGPADSWREQLADYYSRQPVFALVSGVSEGDWDVIDNFCEEMQIPQLLPNTDQPLAESSGHFYTLYFSKGLALEAEVGLAHLAKRSQGGRIVQLYEPGTSGAYAARALRRAADDYPQFVVDDLVLKEEFDVGSALEPGARAATFVWLDSRGIDRQLRGLKQQKGVFYLSSTLLAASATELAIPVEGPVFLVHQYNLEKDKEKKFRRFLTWAALRKIPLRQQRIQGQTFFASMMLGEGLKHIKGYFYRDYLLDSLDHSDRMALYSNNYPRLSFGPGQRYLAKGAYVVKLSASRDLTLDDEAVWVVP